MFQKTSASWAILLAAATSYGQTSLCTNPIFQFQIPARESNCMRHFRPNASGLNSTNEFFLAKFSEMAYLERLDYQIRYMKNGARTVTSIPSTNWIKQNAMVRNGNVECAFAARFAHYFYDESQRPRRIKTDIGELNSNLRNQSAASQSVANNIGDIKVNVDMTSQRPDLSKPAIEKSAPPGAKPATGAKDFVTDSLAWVKENVPTFRFVRATVSAGFKFLPNLFSWDPEVMLVNSKYGIFIIFRGTDDVGNSAGDMGEWLGTDFFIAQSSAPGISGKVHAGFVANYNLVQAQIKAFLNTYATAEKKIWIAGHSLGGGLAIVSGVLLKAAGYPIQGVYSFGGPRVIGDGNFVGYANQNVPNIQRFEYYLDPITMLGMLGFDHNIGKRNWYDHADYGKFTFYANIEERRLGDPGKNQPFGEFGYNPGVMGYGGDDPEKLEAQRRLKTRLDANLVNFLPPFTNIEMATPSGSRYTQMDRMFFGYHNPPYYVKAAYSRVKKNSPDILVGLPLEDDTWPYVYYDAPGSK